MATTLLSPTRFVHGLRFDNLRGDIFGGITAAIVALPLALAFGVASGAGPIAGLYGAICTGFFAALFGGTPAQISGPTGPMTVVMASTFANLTASNPENGWAMALTVVMFGGIFQVVLGLLGLGKYITFMPYTVISGFMSGIGVIIVILQIAPLLGHQTAPGVVPSLQAIPTYINDVNFAALGLGLIALAIVFFSPPRLNRILPAPLIALVLGTIISMIFFGNVSLPRIGEIPSGLPSLHLPYLSWGSLQQMLLYSIMLAVLGSLDSLLTSLVADNISRSHHDSDRELVGQGIGNLVSGLCGGLPGAGATMRTVININSGGKTPIAGMIHALILLMIVLKAGQLTEPIPHAVLAGILMKVGIDIVDWSFLKRAHQLSTKGAGLMYLVLGLTVFVDLITAVAVGVFVANLFTVKNLTDLQLESIKSVTRADGEDWLLEEEQQILRQANGRIFMFHLSGPMSFGAAKSIARRLAIVENYDVLILDLATVPRLGVTALLAIETMLKDALAKQREVFLVGAKGQVQARLQRLPVLAQLSPHHRLESRLLALQMAAVCINVD